MLNPATAIYATFKANAWKFISLAFLWASPIHGFILFILLAIGADTLFGRKAARITAIREGKEPRLAVTSKKTRHGFSFKVGVYIPLLIVTLFLDKIMLDDLILYFIPTFPVHYLITKGLGIIFILIELDSIDEKCFIITGKRIKDIIKKKLSSIKGLVLGAKKLKDDLED